MRLAVAIFIAALMSNSSAQALCSGNSNYVAPHTRGWGSGSLAYDITTNTLKSCDGTNWNALGGVSTGGAANYVAKFSDAATLGTSQIFDTGSLVSVGTTSTGSLLGVYGGLSVGTTYVATAAPTNGAIIQGNVGIGTTAPSSPLEVDGGSGSASIHIAQFGGNATYSVLDLNNTSSGSSFKNGIQFQKNGNAKWEMGNDLGAAGAQSFFIYDDVASAARLYINASGYVGIGTTSPSTPLEVYNSQNSTSDIRVTNTNAGTSAQARFVAYNGTKAAEFGILSTGYTAFPASSAYIWNEANAPILFGTNGTERVRIDSAGKVGIGTTVPGSLLDVRGVVTAGSASSVAGSTILQGYYTNGALTSFGSEYSTGAPFVGYGVTPNTSAYGSFVSSTPVALRRSALTVGGYTNANDGGFAFYTGGSQTVATGSAVTMSAVMVIDNSGKVGIGTTSPSYTLHVNGSVAGTSAYNNLSDARLKKDVTPIAYGLAEVERLRPVGFNWIDQTEEWKKQHQIGLIAQDVEPLIPEVVTTANDAPKTKSLAYGALVPVLIKAMQELKAENDNQAAELRAEKAEIAELKAELQAFKKAHP